MAQTHDDHDSGTESDDESGDPNDFSGEHNAAVGNLSTLVIKGRDRTPKVCGVADSISKSAMQSFSSPIYI
ncbi:unnamed protein product [Orchesella dallaii]|uniref:Uncharacterized protein n=1 Tax=Orchesella dallaii TaxID=48710 RepID=A0ABP1QSF0_9HEXA